MSSQPISIPFSERLPVVWIYPIDVGMFKVASDSGAKNGNADKADDRQPDTGTQVGGYNRQRRDAQASDKAGNRIKTETTGEPSRQTFNGKLY